MASNGFFEFLGDLKGLYDEASRRRNWAQQYNPYNGGSSWWRGLGAINQMMDRNAEDRALKAQRQEYKASTDNTHPTTGIGADANGVQVMPKQKRFDFADSDYIPSAGNGYHLGDYPQTEMYGDPTDYQRQMASNAIGYNLGSFEPRQQKWFAPSSGGNGFSSIFNGNSFKGGSLVNPLTPSVSSGDSLAQGTEGQSNASARDLSRYLSNDYNIANWMQSDEGRGVSNPYISALRYASKIAPLVQAAKEDRLKNLFMVSSNPDLGDEERKQARIQLAGELNKPDLLGELDFANWQRQKAKEEFEHGKSMWNLDALIKRLQAENAQESIYDRREKRLYGDTKNLGDYAGLNLEGKTWVRNNNSVDLSKATPQTIAGLNHISDWFFNRTGKQLIVTSGNDSAHDEGKYSHGNGWKIDVSGNGLEDPKLRKEFMDYCKSLGIIPWDEYEHKSANWTGGHVDLTFSGYRGNVKAKAKEQKSTQAPTKTVAEGIGINSSVGNWATKGYSDSDLKQVINTLYPIYERYRNSYGMSEDEANGKIQDEVIAALEANLGKKWNEGFDWGRMQKIVSNMILNYRDRHPENFDPNDAGNIPVIDDRNKGKSGGLNRKDREQAQSARQNSTQNGSKQNSNNNAFSTELGIYGNNNSPLPNSIIPDDPNRDKSLTLRTWLNG